MGIASKVQNGARRANTLACCQAAAAVTHTQSGATVVSPVAMESTCLSELKLELTGQAFFRTQLIGQGFHGSIGWHRAGCNRLVDPLTQVVRQRPVPSAA